MYDFYQQSEGGIPMKLKKKILEFAVITFGLALVAAAVYFFMMPAQVSIGSATALAMVLSNFIPLPVSVITLIINVVLLIIGFLLIGPEFGGKTVYCAVLLPGFLGLFEILFPNFQSLTGDNLVDVLCYILVVSIGQATPDLERPIFCFPSVRPSFSPAMPLPAAWTLWVS